MSQNADLLSAGDPIFWRCSACGKTPHVVICGGQDANGIVTQYAHNDPKNNAPLYFYSLVCGDCNQTCDLYVRHIIIAEPTGRINVDYWKNHEAWNNMSYGAQTVIKNKSTGVTYSVSQNPDYLYAYRTSTDLPYGTYEVTVRTGNGSAKVTREVTLNGENAWLYLDYYTLTYHGNGATGGTVSAQQIRLQGESVTVAGQNTLTRTDYTFGGWKTGASSGTAYAQGDTITMTAAVDLYAQWSANVVATLNVTLDGQKFTGLNAMRLYNTQTGELEIMLKSGAGRYDSDAKIPAGRYEIYARSDGDKTAQPTGQYFDLSPTNTSASLAMYTVSFNGNGATGGTAPESLARVSGVAMPVPAAGTMVKSGYTFCYWNDPDKPYIPVMPGATYTVNRKVALQARWLRGAYALGDVNADGKVDTADASLVMQYCGETLELTAAQKIRADFNADGKVDTTDSIRILQAAAGTSLLRAHENPGDAVLSNGRDLSTVEWSDLDWSRVDVNAIDWDNFTLNDLFRLLLGGQSGGEIM